MNVRMRGVLLVLGLIFVIYASAIETLQVEIADDLWEPIPEKEIVETQMEPREEIIEYEQEVKVNEFTYEEAQELLKIASAEAGNQGEEGMWLVMSTIINRRDSETFPNTIHDVVYQPHQYAVEYMNKVKISDEAHLALARIERGEVEEEHKIIGFERTNSHVLNKYFDEAFSYGDHVFYKER